MYDKNMIQKKRPTSHTQRCMMSAIIIMKNLIINNTGHKDAPGRSVYGLTCWRSGWGCPFVVVLGGVGIGARAGVGMFFI